MRPFADMIPRAGISLLFIVSFASATAAPTPCEANGPANALKKKIALSPIPFPARFSNDRAFIKYVRKADTHEFYEDKVDGGWFVFHMSFFEKPLSQSRYLVLFYDVTDPRAPILITQTTSHPAKRGLRIMAGEYELERGLFKPDKRYLMLFTPSIDAKALAETEFVLRAHSPNRSKKHTSSLKEAARKAEEDAARSKEKRDARKRSSSPKFNFDSPDF